jgi:outer membrane receptor protein involved in Fe transport
VEGTHPSNHEQYYQGTVRLDYSTSKALGLTSLTTYEKYKESDADDTSGVNVISQGQLIDGTVKSISQEFRVHGATAGETINWLLGINYESDKTNEVDTFDEYFVTASYLTNPPFTELTQIANTDASTKSVFGNVDYRVIDALNLHGGIRYTKSDQTFSGCTASTSPAATDVFNGIEAAVLGREVVTATPGECVTLGPTFLPGLQSNRLDQNNVPWRVGADWKPSDRDLVYLSVSKGFKAGASPALGATSYIQLKPVTQESLLSYELGLKSSLPEQNLKINADVFHYDYKDKQFLGRTIDPSGIFGALEALVNVPHSMENGSEVSAQWRPIRGWTFNLAATYLDSKVTSDFENYDDYGVPVNFKGESFPYTPKWSVQYGARYEWRIDSDLSAFVGADASYQTATVGSFGAAQEATEGPPENIKSYGLLNLSAGLESLDHHWRAQAWGKNVTNTYYWTSVFYLTDTVDRDAGMPATYGITVNYRY